MTGALFNEMQDNLHTPVWISIRHAVLTLDGALFGHQTRCSTALADTFHVQKPDGHTDERQ